MVAGMVFTFSIVAVVVKALQPYLTRRRYDWIFDRFSLISLPLWYSSGQAPHDV